MKTGSGIPRLACTDTRKEIAKAYLGIVGNGQVKEDEMGWACSTNGEEDRV
jgi:hypothetical protein